MNQRHEAWKKITSLEKKKKKKWWGGNSNIFICTKIQSPCPQHSYGPEPQFSRVLEKVMYLLYRNKSVNLCDMSAQIFSTCCTSMWRTSQQFLLPDTEIMNKFSLCVVLMTLIKPEGNWLSTETKHLLQEILFNLYSNSGTSIFQPENHHQSLSWMIIQWDNTAKTILHLGAIISPKRTFSTNNLQ